MLAMLLTGYSAYALIPVRGSIPAPPNSVRPDDPFSFASYQAREQYGSAPLLYGHTPYSRPLLVEEFVTDSVTGKRKAEYKRYALRQGHRVMEAAVPGAKLGHSGSARLSAADSALNSRALERGGDAYLVRGYTTSYRLTPELDMWFPRITSRDERDLVSYNDWLGMTPSTMTHVEVSEAVDSAGNPVGRMNADGKREKTASYRPTYLQNLQFMLSYQIGYMYLRYLMWNFSGRQNDIPSQGEVEHGNFITGIPVIDNAMLGAEEALPPSAGRDNPGRNRYYMLPLILGIIGIVGRCRSGYTGQASCAVIAFLFIMTGVAIVVYLNQSPGEPRERDYVYAGSFYAFCIWIGLGVLAVCDLIVWATRRKGLMAPIAATVVCMVVPGILAAQNWDDHDRSHRTMARDIGWNYLQSVLPNAIIINYGDNDTFPLWFNQEVDGVRPDVRIMNTSYLGAEWYIDEMKTKANDAPGVPFTLPRSKYTYTNDIIPIFNVVDRPLELKEAIDFIRSEDPRTKYDLGDGHLVDYLPNNRFALPVNKDNAIASGIVKESDRDLMVDTIYLELPKRTIDKSEMMLLDMLAHFDWKRPIHFTQVYILQSLGLLNYLQFDGYSYRLVPIYTPNRSVHEIGRIDPDYITPLLTETFRYGNIADPRTYADYFIQYNLSASKARESFARAAKEYVFRGDSIQAIRLLDMGLEKLPPQQIRYTDANTFPFIEGYYMAGAPDKGDSLLMSYARNLMQYIDYYLDFQGIQGDMVTQTIIDKMQSLDRLYYLAAYMGRQDVLAQLNDYYRTLGIYENELIHPDLSTPSDSVQIPE